MTKKRLRWNKKHFFILFKGLSMKKITQIFLEGESPALKSLRTTPSNSFFIRSSQFNFYGSLAYKNILSVSCQWFIKFSSTLDFPDAEPPAITILLGWLRIFGRSRFYSFVFFPVTSSKLIILFIFLLLFSVYSKGFS